MPFGRISRPHVDFACSRLREARFSRHNASAEVDAGKVTISGPTAAESAMFSPQMSCAVSVQLARGEAVFSTSAAARADGLAEINLPAEWSGDPVQIYLGFVSQDGKAIANSIYLGEKTLI